MDLTLGYDSAAYQPSTGFDLIPNNTQVVALVSEIAPKPTKAAGGLMYAFTFDVVEGDYTGRKLWHNANVKNASPKAEQIGREEIAAIQAATGCHGSPDLSGVFNVPMILTVGVKKDAEYGDKNVIKSFKPYAATGTSPQQQQQAVQTAQTQQAGGQQTPAWAR